MKKTRLRGKPSRITSPFDTSSQKTDFFMKYPPGRVMDAYEGSRKEGDCLPYPHL